MSALQIFEIVAVIAIVVAVVVGIGLALVYRRLQRYQRNQHVIMGSRGTVDIVEHVAAVDDKMANLRLAVEDLTLAARDHDVRIDTTLSRVGIVRFDAYQDLGGRQSTAVAFLNSIGDGVVITTVVSRDFARMYVKLLKDGAADIPLAPEETEAVEQARGSGPFTIRPRIEMAQRQRRSEIQRGDGDRGPRCSRLGGAARAPAAGRPRAGAREPQTQAPGAPTPGRRRGAIRYRLGGAADTRSPGAEHFALRRTGQKG